ncbi:hypothetical protein [Helicobacter canis]|uniref:Uncharacterized protein n=1 Tax=Helicobacter canis NCTC 12740 TaxID=1357399 RepID=V8CE27_9HELI|nr:hypothetical protein [Helicobacter canis]ETD25604.1 hypothetical protein HMPREF2087_01432 [Helicobacter canis NCTC 12740]
MTSILAIVYLMDIVGRITTFAIICAIIFSIIAGFAGVQVLSIKFDEKSPDITEQDKKIVGNIFKISSTLLAISIFFAIFTPTQFFLTALAGFKAGNMIVEQPKINIILDKTYKILENKLDELLVESDKKIEQGDVK